MFGSQITSALCSFLEEIVYKLIDDSFVYHGLDWVGIVLQDVDQTLLNEGSVDVIGMLQEKVYPSWKINFVLDKVLDNLFHQYVW